MATTIVTKSGSGAPTASDLVAGELAVDLTNKRLYTEDSGGTVLEVGSNPYNFTANHDGSAKLATTATGIDVTGDIVLGDSNPTITMNDSSVANLQHLITSSSNDLIIAADNNDVDAGTEIQFYVDGVERMATSATGIDVTGSVTADGLTVDGGASAFGSTASDAYIMRSDGTGTAPFNLAGSLVYQPRSTDSNGYGDHLFYTGSTQKLRQKISADGSISFYEDTGTTPKFFWDASAESLGIGTSSPSALLHLKATGGSVIQQFETTGGTVARTWKNFVSSGTGAYHIQDATASANRIVIDTSGNVGIGTSSPDTKGRLAVSSAAGDTDIPSLYLNQRSSASNVNKGIAFGIDGTLYGRIVSGQSGSGGAMAFHTGASLAERMRIDSSGNLLVGTTSGGARLRVTGAASLAASIVQVGTNGYPAISFNNAAGVQQGYIVTNAASVALVSVSDRRLKENIADADDAGSKIDAIQVRKFDWKADGSHQDYGMVAQELLEVAPEAVSAPEDPEEMMGVDYSKLVPMMLKEIQSLRQRIAALES